MDDLISRQAAIDATNKAFDRETLLNRFVRKVAIDAIKQLPTAEKRGEWIEHNPHQWGLGIVYECDQCGEKINCETSNYCPNCGARMEE